MERTGFYTINLGCKLNQFDGAALEGELRRRGLRHEPDPARAGVVIVNTCTVTHRADAEARRLVRSVRRANPGCTLLVTGCYAEREPDALRGLVGVDRVFGNRDKARVGAILDGLGIGAPVSQERGSAVGPAPAGDRGCDGSLELPPALHFGERSRAFLKIQDGCRLRCSYCVIPRVRGPSRSVPADRVVAAAAALARSGYREIVLTGVNTGDYGRDLNPRLELAELLRRLLMAVGPTRVRLNSLEPLTVSDAIIELMAAEPRLAPHLQVPLQSGSPEILRRMRRNYGVETYLERLQRLRAAVPHVGLGADVIVGFPGESEARFQETYDLIAGSPLNYLHVFRWSPRPGTPAAGSAGAAEPSAVRRRSARLRALADRLSFGFRRGFEGRRLDAIVLGGRRRDGRLRALTGNFIETVVQAGHARPGAAVELRVVRVTPRATYGVIEGVPSWARSGADSPPHQARRASGRCP